MPRYGNCKHSVPFERNAHNTRMFLFRIAGSRRNYHAMFILWHAPTSWGSILPSLRETNNQLHTAAEDISCKQSSHPYYGLWATTRNIRNITRCRATVVTGTTTTTVAQSATPYDLWPSFATRVFSARCPTSTATIPTIPAATSYNFWV